MHTLGLQHARIASVLIALVSLCFLGVSAVLAVRFGQLLATTPTERETYAALGVATSALKALLPFVLAAAWLGRRWLTGMLAVAALTVCCIYSMTAAYSVGAASRAPQALESEAQARIAQQIAVLGLPRPVSVLEPLIANERERNAKALLLSEAASSRELVALRLQLKPSAGDAGVQSLAQVSGLPVETVRSLLLGLMAIGLELGEVAGLWFASVLWSSGRSAPAPEPTTPQVAPVTETVQKRETDATVIAMPTPAVDTAPATPARKHSAPAAWLRQWLETTSGEVASDVAWTAYSAEFRERKRKLMPRLAFSRLFNETAAEIGMAKRVAGGRILYRAA